MSEVQTSVGEQSAAPVEATPVVEPTTEAEVEATPAPATEETTTAVESSKDEEPVGTAETSTVPTTAAASKKAFTGEGILGYKAPGGNFIKKLAGFQKKYFWFGSDAVDRSSLQSYLRGEKQEIANHNVAWSSQTGKGLLYFSKFASEKGTPAGIINLADITEITEDGTVDFFFMLHESKHIFQASNVIERESWVAALKTNSTEAKGMVDDIKNSEVYKNQHSSLSKPTAIAPVAVSAATMSKEPETKKEQKAEIKEEKKEEKAEAKEEKKEVKARKSRSASRKRNSIFGTLGLGSKKEEPVESKEEQKVDAKEAVSAEPTTTEPATTEPATTEPVLAPLDAPAVAAAALAAPVVDEPAETPMTTSAPVEQVKPTAPANKRNSSIFGSLPRFGQKKTVADTKPMESTSAVPIKDADIVEPVSAEAPVIPAPEASEPLEAAVASPATVPVTEVTNGVTETEEAKPEIKTEMKAESAQKRKSSLPFGLGQSKEKKDEVEGEKSKTSPFARLRQTIKGKSSPKPVEKAPEKAEEAPATEPVTETPATTTEAGETTATTEPITTEPLDATPAPAPEVSVTA